jgi:hypothetical protein
MTDTLASSDHRPVLGAVARVLVPVGTGVLTWILVLLAGGAVLSSSVSVFSVVLLAGVGVLFVPVYQFRPWEPGLTERVLAFGRRRRHTLVVAVGLFVLVRLPVVSDLLGPVLSLLLLPLRVVPQILFGVTVFYGARVGDSAGQLLFDVGRLYAEFLWLYAVGAGIVLLVLRGGE